MLEPPRYCILGSARFWRGLLTNLAVPRKLSPLGEIATLSVNEHKRTWNDKWRLEIKRPAFVEAGRRKLKLNSVLEGEAGTLQSQEAQASCEYQHQSARFGCRDQCPLDSKSMCYYARQAQVDGEIEIG